ncbi:MAG: Chemoreceptor glutamine deamidase CheD [Candidatus Dichloromethanomonas elyunquensis]|nr:MAG: Chemoreceptor glutamine deamidase CheD [Candidatus Dichloromethanomonas elyunquensis]
MSNTILVGMADFKVGKTPDKLMTAGLGSCIGVCIYDLQSQVGGMAHIMLPSSGDNMKGNAAKYADSCIELLLKDLYRLGANRIRLKAKMAGGAQMFSFTGKTPLLKIGERNAEAVEQELKKAGIPLLAYDIGGTFGRTINFNIKTGDLHIKTISHGEKVI